VICHISNARPVPAVAESTPSEREILMMSELILEAAAQEIADATSKPPFLYELGVEGARKVLDRYHRTR
jgi:hypothetical protein